MILSNEADLTKYLNSSKEQQAKLISVIKKDMSPDEKKIFDDYLENANDGARTTINTKNENVAMLDRLIKNHNAVEHKACMNIKEPIAIVVRELNEVMGSPLNSINHTAGINPNRNNVSPNSSVQNSSNEAEKSSLHRRNAINPAQRLRAALRDLTHNTGATKQTRQEDNSGPKPPGQ